MIIKAQGVVVVAAAFIAVSPAFAGDINLSGMKLGSDANELKQAMIATDASLEINDFTAVRGGAVKGYVAQTSTSRGQMVSAPYLLGGLFDPAGKVWLVGKAQQFPDGGRPTVEATLAAWREKFGPPTYGNINHMEWQFDRSGTLYTGRPNDGPCPLDIPSFTSIRVQARGSSLGFFAPERFIGSCGTKIVAGALNTNGMVASLVVVAFDSASQFDRIEHSKAAAAAEKQKKLEEEQKRGVTPKL